MDYQNNFLTKGLIHLWIIQIYKFQWPDKIPEKKKKWSLTFCENVTNQSW